MDEPNPDRISDVADIIVDFCDVPRDVAEQTARAILYLPEIADALGANRGNEGD